MRAGLSGYAALDLLSSASGGAAALLTSVLGYVAVGEATAVAAPLLLAVLPSFQAWTGSGMETPLAVLALASAVYMTFAVRVPRGFVLAGAMAGALTWVRPEMMALFPSLLCVLLTKLSSDRRIRAFALFSAAWVVPIVMLFLGRHAYFHEWLPNTYYAKVAGGGLEQRLRGLHYVSTFFVQQAFYCALSAFAVTRPNASIRCLGLITLNVVLSIVWAGGDGFPYSRLTLPALPFVCVMSASVLTELRRKEHRLLGVGGLAMISALWSNKIGGEFKRYMVCPSFAANAAQIAELIREAPPGTVATEGIGAIAYITGRPILDLLGLADKHIARSLRIPGAMIGHDHKDIPYVLSKGPEIVLPLIWLRPEPLTDESEITAMTEQIDSYASALALVEDPTFRARYRPRTYEREGKYLRLWLRRDVFDRTLAGP